MPASKRSPIQAFELECNLKVVSVETQHTGEEKTTLCCTMKIIVCRVQVGKMIEFVKHKLFLKMHLGGGLAPSSQIEGSLLIPLASEAGWKNAIYLTN